MAEKLMKYYAYVAEKKGLAGKLELAKRTLMPGPKAAIEPDSPENIRKFKKVVEQITEGPAPNFF